jgi:putative CocE/NonD family hydrolase
VADLSVIDCRVPMRDGTLLAADVVRVADAGRQPVLLVRTPYSRAAMRLAHDVIGLARDDWTVVVQDVRGRFDSGGRFTAFEQEVDDGYDTVEWCATQPWSDGRVAMTGWSYVGATQWLAALSGHPALLAINPVVGAGDIADAMLSEGGAFQVGLVQPWVLGLAASDPAADDEHRSAAGTLGGQWAQTLRAAPGLDPVAELVPSYRSWRTGGEREVTASVHGRYDRVRVAAYQVAGWYDIFCESALRHWQGMAASAHPQRLVIGPWSHSNGLSNLHPEVDFGPEGNGVYGGRTGGEVHWMRRVLDGEDVPTGISCFVMHEGWRELTAWPPPTRDLVLHLDRDALHETPPAAAGEVELNHDPHDPVPTWGGRVLGPFLPMPGPVDQRTVEARDDVLVFTSDLFEAPVAVLGMVTARVRATSTARSMDVVVKLCDVHPDGRSINIVDSVRRVDLQPGEWVDVEVDVGSTAYCVRPGHRLRLHVAGSNFPRFDVNPGTGDAPGTALRLDPAVHRIAWGPERGSVLRLPVDA